MSIKRGLGKGFDSLVPVGVNVDVVAAGKSDKIHHLSVDIIKPKPGQPRQNFNEQLLNQLAQSIKEQGILQPIVVAEVEHNSYSIIAGERRWRAAILAGLKTVPAIIKKVDELEHLELSLLENLQRADLNPIETSQTIVRLHTEYQQSYEDIAKKLGKAYTTVVNSARLAQLPSNYQDALIKGDISEGHARSVLSLAKYPIEQQKLFDLIVNNKISVRQAEEYAYSIKKANKDDSLKNKESIKAGKNDKIASNISNYLGVPVKISNSTNKGKITISYNSKDELALVLGKLNIK